MCHGLYDTCSENETFIWNYQHIWTDYWWKWVKFFLIKIKALLLRWNITKFCTDWVCSKLSHLIFFHTGLIYPESEKIYEKTNRNVEKWCQLVFFVAVKGSSAAVPLLMFSVGYYRYFTTNIGNDAFELLFRTWYKCIYVFYVLYWNRFEQVLSRKWFEVSVIFVRICSAMVWNLDFEANSWNTFILGFEILFLSHFTWMAYAFFAIEFLKRRVCLIYYAR